MWQCPSQVLWQIQEAYLDFVLALVSYLVLNWYFGVAAAVAKDLTIKTQFLLESMYLQI